MTAPASRTTPTSTPRRSWLALTALVLPVLLASMDLSVLYLAMPTIGAALDPSASQSLWIIDIYGFLLAGLLITMGNVGDRVGRRRLLMIGATVFGIGSVGAAMSPSAEILIAARAFMGIGGATLMPSTLSLIRSIFTNDRDRTRAIAIWTAAFAGGSVLGPIVGGILLEFFDWGSVFLINVPVLVILLLVVPWLVPEYRDPNPGRLDILSVALSMAALLPFVWAVKRSAEQVSIDGPALAAAVMAFVAAVSFVRRQRRLTAPLLDVSLFTSHRFTGAIIGGCLAMFTLGGVMYFMAQYLQLIEGFSPLIAALWLLPAMVGVSAGSTLAPVMADRWGRPVAFRTGFIAAAAGLGVLVLVSADVSLIVLIGGTVLLGFGIAAPMALATDIVMASAPTDRAGAASAISETGNELGAALGVAIFGSTGVAVYRATVESGLPGDLPAPAAEAVTSTTLPTALDLASQLAPEWAGPVLSAAKNAFTDGMAVSALGGSVVLVGLAIIVPRLLRRP